MSEPIKTILAPSHAAAQAHGIPKGKHVAGHKIVVEGFYFAGVIDAAGSFEKKRVAYREEFTLRAREHKLHGQGALGHILSDKVLAARLSSKDKNFRSIQTHVVTHHENILVNAPAQLVQIEPKAEEVNAPDEEGLDEEAPTEDDQQEA